MLDRAEEVLVDACARADGDAAVTRLTTRTPDDRDGWFVPPTIYRSEDPTHELFTTELYGPVLAVYVFDDADFDDVLALVDRTSPYALTGSIFATDRDVLDRAAGALR